MSNPRERSRPNTFLAWLVVACLLPSGIASAAPSIALSKKSGPPTSRILVSGRGFKPHVGVDIFFDTKDKALVVTNGKGEFHDAVIHAPRSARPGQHWVTALERNNDKGAQKLFLVQTDWNQFHFDPQRLGVNPYENVLSPKTVRNLQLKWSYTTVGCGASSTVVVDGVVYFGLGNGNMYTLKAASGELLWSYSTQSAVFSAPALADGMVYFGSFDNNVYALDAGTGKKVWEFATGRQVQADPTVLLRSLFWPDALDPYMTFSFVFIGVVPALLGYYHLGRLGFLLNVAAGFALAWIMAVCGMLCFAFVGHLSGSAWLSTVAYAACLALVYIFIVRFHLRAAKSPSVLDAQRTLHLLPTRTV